VVINEMVEQVKALGALNLPGRFADWDREMAALEAEVHASEQETKPAEAEVVHA
jgi:hypothetical protein